jgi:catechol 2,3-dioxygenase-like lactoylglutathione lyase family enzyme
MISYTTIGCTNFEQSKKFFDATLGALNYAMLHDYSEHGTVAYGDPKQAEQANGGRCDGPPGLRENYGPNMYLAYVRDSMGNKFSAMCTAAI